MTRAKPFRLLDDKSSLELLRAKLARIGYEIASISIPDTAYEESEITLSNDRSSDHSMKIVLEKAWWPDGETWEDRAVGLFLNEEVLVRINLQELLRGKLNKPLREHVVEVLSDVVEKTMPW